MSIQSEIERINGNVASAYSVLSAKGATMPSERNTANLASAIESIQAGEAMSIETVRLICGWQANGLPAGYTLLEYIQGTGTQYIDTGFAPNNNTRVVMEAAYVSTPTANAVLFGARTSATSKNYTLLCSSGGTLRSDYNTEYTQTWSIDVTGRFVVDKNKETTTISNVSQSYTNATFQCDYGLYLLCLNNAGSPRWYSSARLYSCQIYDNGTLVRDYVPCLNDKGVPGLFDKVNSKFYGNAGTGAFKAGFGSVELPDGYTKLSYIQSSGTQYIDTGVVGKSGLQADVVWEFTSISSNQTILGSKNGSVRFFMMHYTTAFSYGYSDFVLGSLSASTGVKYTIHSDMTAGAQKLIVNGTTVASGTTATVLTTDDNLSLFALNADGGYSLYSSGKVYSCQIYDNGRIVRNYVPCINPSGAYGLYDAMNAVFYGNAGSGTFTGA